MAFHFSLEMLGEPVKKQTPARSEKDAPVWIGVDLDGTLAVMNEWKGWDHIGDPIPKMVERIKAYRKAGRTVKILTARASKVSLARNGVSFSQMEKVIQDWTEKYLGERLPVVTEKDCYFLGGYDDKIMRVEKNTGAVIGEDFLKHEVDDDEAYNQEVKELDYEHVSDISDPNSVIITKQQEKDLCAGLVKAGFSKAEPPSDWRGCQFMCYASNDKNKLSFCFNTVKGKFEGNAVNVLVCIIQAVNGAHEIAFNYDTNNFKAIGLFLGKMVLKK